ncbi:MAG: phosphoglucosamine mutase, partial [Acidimicrobiales bacterium]
ALGRAAARVFGAERFFVGRDTRISGPLLQAALSAGMAAEGADVADLGVLPTPGVAWVSAAEDQPGAVISASHNPFGDNGIKFFSAGGRKLDDELEARLEAELDRLLADTGSGGCPTGSALGRLVAFDGAGPYGEALVATADRALSRLSVVVDCGNGAASAIAPQVLRELGADVTVVNAEPDGLNINRDCGSTHPAGLQRVVVERGADAGLAFDGDADRVVAVDHRGELVDGDHLIAICALDRRQRGRLPDDTVVVTVMSNLGLRQALAANDIRWVETDVGDRAVLEALEKGGWSLGGEQSGHVIFRDLSTTGDGILTGLQVLEVMARTGAALADLAAVMTRSPQVLRNVPVVRRSALDGNHEVATAMKAVSAKLGDRGRVLVRPSGTEELVRVMVEAPTAADAETACAALCVVVERSMGVVPAPLQP